MDNVAQKTDEALSLARAEKYDAALPLFSQLAGTGGPHREDPGFWIQFGDLQVRAGQGDEAAESYQRAVGLLSGSGMPNAALALCRRILTIVPDDPPTERTLAELAGAQGYLRDAREAYEQLAENSRARGDRSGAAEALASLLGILERNGASADADAVRRRLLELDPTAASRGADHGAQSLAPASEPTWDDSLAEAAPEVGASLELDDVGLEPATFDLPADDGPAAPAAELEATQPPAEWEGGLELPGEDLPMLSGAEGEEEEPGAPLDPLPALEGLSLDLPEPVPAAAEPLSRPATAEPEEEEEEEEEDPVEVLRARIAARPGDLEAHRELIAILGRERRDPDLVTALADAEEVAARDDRFLEAAEFAGMLADLRPEDLSPARRQVEHATRSGDHDAMISAFLVLGQRLSERAPDRARETFLRVLELDPGNVTAERALRSLPSPPPPRPAAPTPEYVNLGELVRSDEPAPRTRFQVEATGPSGDEDSDFAEILNLFRQRVTEELDPEDAASHYDLGLAFKEMGLLDDAIAQLQLAVRGGSNPLATLEVLGECFVQKGEHKLAARVLRYAAELPGASDPELIGVYYWLGRCEEVMGHPEDALGCYEQVVAIDVGFRDAATRLDILRGGRGAR